MSTYVQAILLSLHHGDLRLFLLRHDDVIVRVQRLYALGKVKHRAPRHLMVVLCHGALWWV